jgi:hypothetical protein
LGAGRADSPDQSCPKRNPQAAGQRGAQQCGLIKTPLPPARRMKWYGRDKVEYLIWIFGPNTGKKQFG